MKHSSRHKKKILVPLFYRGHYGRLRPVLKAIRNHPDLELQVMTAAQAAYHHFFMNIRHSEPRHWLPALAWYVRARFRSGLNMAHPFRAYKNDYVTQKLKEDGIPIHACVPFFFDGGVPATMAKSAGLGVMKIVDELRRLKPYAVFVNADRFEMMAVVLAAAYLNIPIIHNEGGDVSGTIDESVRHAITKFAHIHFVSTEQSRKRVIQMGEDPEAVFAVGSPAIDVAKTIDVNAEHHLGPVDLKKPFLFILAHPVTTESGEANLSLIHSVIAALDHLKMPAVWIGGNSDAGSDVVGRTAAEWCEKQSAYPVYFAKHLHPDHFCRALARAACAIGNSSSFIREGAFFGTPIVLVGSRQTNRERAANIKEVPVDANAVITAARSHIAHGRFPQSVMFGDGKAAERMVEVIAAYNPSVQKNFRDIDFMV